MSASVDIGDFPNRRINVWIGSRVPVPKWRGSANC